MPNEVEGPLPATLRRGVLATLRYLHRNPVKRGLVTDPADWKWSSYRHYALRKGVVEIESEWTARDRVSETEASPTRVFLNPG